MSSTAIFNPSRLTDGLTERTYKTLPAEIDAERQKLVGWLEGKYGGHQRSSNLADRLDNCRRKQRCKSAACPVCAAATVALAVTAIWPFLKNHPDRKKLVCVSGIPADGQVAPGKLNAADHRRRERRWKDAFSRAGVTWFLGAFDWSFNTHSQGKYSDHWSVHFYGFTATADPKALKKALKQQFPNTAIVVRPVHVKPWDGSKDAIRYMLKTRFWRRIATDNGQRHASNGGKRNCKDTDKQPLKSKQKRELLLHRDELGIQGRFMLRGLRFVIMKGHGWVITDLRSRSRKVGRV